MTGGPAPRPRRTGRCRATPGRRSAATGFPTHGKGPRGRAACARPTIAVASPRPRRSSRRQRRDPIVMERRLRHPTQSTPRRPLGRDQPRPRGDLRGHRASSAGSSSVVKQDVPDMIRMATEKPPRPDVEPDNVAIMAAAPRQKPERVAPHPPDPTDRHRNPSAQTGGDGIVRDPGYNGEAAPGEIVRDCQDTVQPHRIACSISDLEFGDQRRGGERPGERRTLAGPLGPVAELARGLRGGVQRLPGVIGDRVVRDRPDIHRVAQGRESVREASCRAARDRRRHDGVHARRAEQGGPEPLRRPTTPGTR